MTCELCGFVFDEDNIEESIESHLQEKHYLGYQDYYEIKTLGTPNISCWKCGSPRYTISPYISGSYLPCSCCINPRSKQGIQEIRQDLFSKIREYQGKLVKSRYYQYAISLSQSQRERLLPKDLEIQSEVLSEIKRNDIKLDKSSIFKVNHLLGRSSEISFRNLDALSMEVSEFKATEVSPGKWKLGEKDLYLKLPEVVPYDPKHHSRGSILNKSAKRTTRRLKLSETGECIKFWNIPGVGTKTILSLVDGEDKIVQYQDLSEEIRWKIRFGILKTKPILTRVFEIYNELIRYVIGIEDSVFLLNSFKIPSGPSIFNLRLTWSWEDQSCEAEENYIKLSIL